MPYGAQYKPDTKSLFEMGIKKTSDYDGAVEKYRNAKGMVNSAWDATIGAVLNPKNWHGPAFKDFDDDKVYGSDSTKSVEGQTMDFGVVLGEDGFNIEETKPRGINSDFYDVFKTHAQPQGVHWDYEQEQAIEQGEDPGKVASPKQDFMARLAAMLGGVPRDSAGPGVGMQLLDVKKWMNKLKGIQKFEDSGLKGTKDLLAKLKKDPLKTDLTMAAKLVDTWTGSDLASAYDRPMSKKERDFAVAELEDRMGQYKDKRNQRREDISLKEMEFEYKLRDQNYKRTMDVYKAKASRAKGRFDDAIKAARIMNYASQDEDRQSKIAERAAKVAGEGGVDEMKALKKTGQQLSNASEIQKIKVRMDESIHFKTAYKNLTHLKAAIAEATGSPAESDAELRSNIIKYMKQENIGDPEEAAVKMYQWFAEWYNTNVGAYDPKG